MDYPNKPINKYRQKSLNMYTGIIRTKIEPFQSMWWGGQLGLSALFFLFKAVRCVSEISINSYRGVIMNEKLKLLILFVTIMVQIKLGVHREAKGDP